MYESPINQILGEMQIAYENECMKSVQSVGFVVNKEELTKALAYDRKQYEKGCLDGYKKAIDDFAKEIEAEYDNDASPNVSDYLDYKISLRDLFKIAEQLKSKNES